MGKVLAIIGCLLVALIVVAFTVALHEDQVRVERKAKAAIFHFGPESVDRISVEGPDGQRSDLSRRGDGWIIATLGDFPADDAKVEQMLRRLLAIDRDRPVDSDRDSLRAFRLTDEDFARRITLARGEEVLATVIVGTSQGPRQVHARLPGEAQAYTVTFGLFDAVPAAAEWIDKGVLRIAPDDIAAIDVAGLRLVAPAKGGVEGWHLEDPGKSGVLNPTAAEHLLDLLADLQIEGMLPAEASEADIAAPELTLTVVLRSGAELVYDLSRSEPSSGYALAVSRFPQVFLLSPYAAHQIIDAAQRDRLLEPHEGVRHHAASDLPSPVTAPLGAHN